MEQPMRDLSVSGDSRSDSSSSPPPPPQTVWPHGMGTDSTSLQFSSMMYSLPSQFGSSSLQTSSSPFDFSSTSQQYSSLYQNSLSAATGYPSWAYSGAYGFNAAAAYQGVYGTEAAFKDVTVPTTAGSSAASTPTTNTTFPSWAISHDGKKKRQPYKKDQISRLEYEYSVNAYLTNKRRSELSKQLSLDEKQVKVWFQNRRMKDKKLKERVAGPFPHGAPITPVFERLIN